LTEKWFGPISGSVKKEKNLPSEPGQTAKRTLTVEANVPADALYKAYHMSGRFDKDFYSSDLLSDILGRGHSSRLYNQLVKEREIFTSVSSFTLGSLDPGLMVVSGRLKEGITLEEAEEEVDKIIQKAIEGDITTRELEKVKAQAESSLEFGEVELMHRAMNLAFSKLSGDANLVNRESDLINAVSLDDISRVAKEIFREKNSGVMYYKAKK
jgi:zinc protease